jgi:hypothetical protein
MHNVISPKRFDDLQATANIAADVMSEDASILFGAEVETEMKKDDLLMDELAVLFGMYASKSSAPSKNLVCTSMPVTHAVDLPPPVRFSRTNRRPITSQRSD